MLWGIKSFILGLILWAFGGKYDVTFLTVIGIFCMALPIIVLLIMIFAKGEHHEGLKELETGQRAKVKEYKVEDKKLNKGEFAYSVWSKDIWHGLNIEMFNYMMGVFGTTGSGKTTSMSWMYQSTALNFENSPIIIIDAKPDYKKIAEYQKLCEATKRPFYGFNCGNKLSYDFLNNGSPTEIKDKIISLKNSSDWDSDYYKTQAESYIQNALYILKEVKESITLDDVIDSLNIEEFKKDLPSKLSDKSQRRLKRIENTEAKDLKGIANQLSLLADSDYGDWLSSGAKNEFTLNEAVEKNGFVYFALPSMKYPTFARLMGYLAIGDFKTVLEERKEQGNMKDVFCFFDEFSAFAGEQVVNILNQGRGLGVHCVVGTQTLADIETVGGRTLVNQILGNINSMIIHTIGDHDTAQYLADKIGHKDRKKYKKAFDEKGFGAESGGSVELETVNIIEPQEMKELGQGVAFLTSTIFDGGLLLDKLKVTYYPDYLEAMFDTHIHDKR